ncbi:MAG: YcxB family protein [Desulfosarcinaceae bacterium]|nr:YcxB family protein [Desulfosarcinaceae bacterium]
MMKFAYHNSVDDLIALQRCMLRHSAFGQKLMLHRFIMVEVVLAFICGMFAINGNPFKVLLAFAALSVLAWHFRERSVIQQFKRDFKRELRKDEDNSFAKPRILQISPQHLAVSTGNHHQTHPWRTVEWTGQDDRRLYIITTGVLHYAVPKSVFKDPEEMQSFLKRVDTYRDDAAGSLRAAD